jgi:hypothetical protein
VPISWGKVWKMLAPGHNIFQSELLIDSQTQLMQVSPAYIIIDVSIWRDPQLNAH